MAGSGYSDELNTYEFVVARFQAGGNLDSTFNGTGKVTTHMEGGDYAAAVAIQGDGKIVVAGTSSASSGFRMSLVRYNVDGTLDETFNDDGKVITGVGPNGSGATDVAIQPDGKIAVVGYALNASGSPDIAIVRYDANGTLDTTFNGTGIVTVPTGAAGGSAGYNRISIQSDGKILVAGTTGTAGGSDFLVLRYLPNGNTDPSFNGSGKVVTDFGGRHDYARDLVVQSDSRILVAGYSTLNGDFDMALARYNADGSPDVNFNNTGIATSGAFNAVGTAVGLLNNGVIVVAGYTIQSSGGDFALAFFPSNGKTSSIPSMLGHLTTDFGSDSDSLADLAIQADGKIVAVGSTNSSAALARYMHGEDSDADGILDIQETGTGIYQSPEDTGTSPAVPDSDEDGLNDGEEVLTIGSDPNVADTDGDGFDDGFEVRTGFDPNLGSSSPDTMSTIRTAVEFRFNAANGINYRIEGSYNLQDWSTLEENIVGGGEVITRFFSIENQPKRFFRAIKNQ